MYSRVSVDKHVGSERVKNASSCLIILNLFCSCTKSKDKESQLTPGQEEGPVRQSAHEIPAFVPGQASHR